MALEATPRPSRGHPPVTGDDGRDATRFRGACAAASGFLGRRPRPEPVFFQTDRPATAPLTHPPGARPRKGGTFQHVPFQEESLPATVEVNLGTKFIHRRLHGTSNSRLRIQQ